MPWYFPWSDSIKKRACRYLLQHYLGQFLKEKLTLDQLSVDLYNGTGIIQEVMLDVWSLNSMLESSAVPIEIVDGFIGQISVTIPWSALISDSSHMEIRNLELTIQPKQRTDTAGVMLDSMFHSMTTSMQLAQDVLRTEPMETEIVADAAQPFDGLEMFAQTIETVLTRIKLTFIDTIIRLEHLPKEAKTGAALEIRINRIEYFDEVANESGSPVDKTSPTSKTVYEPAAIAHKNFHFMGVQVMCDEFPECHRTFSRTSSSSPQSPKAHDSDVEFSPPIPSYISGRQSSPDSKHSKDSTSPPNSGPIKIAGLMGRQELKFKLKQNEELPGPKLEMDCILGGINLHLSPRQVHLLLEICHGLATPGLCDDSNVRPRGATNKPMMPSDYERVEHELQRQLQHGRLEHQHQRLWQEIDEGLTNQPLDDSEDEMYFDIHSSSYAPSLNSQFDSASMDSSLTSTTTNRSASTVTSTMMNYASGGGFMRKESPFHATIPKSAFNRQHSRKHKDSLHKMLDDPTAEVTRYKIKLSFLSAIILHEDPPATPSDGLDTGQTSAEKLEIMAEQFFGRAASINTTGMGVELKKLRAQYSEACPHDHLGILCKPVSISCNQKSSAVMSSMHADITVGIAEVVESVFDRRTGSTPSFLGIKIPLDSMIPDYCELLVFPQDDTVSSKPTSMFSSMSGASPCIKVKIQHVERRQQSSRRMSTAPKTEVHMELGKCQSEFDITIVDRIQALLNPQPLAQSNISSSNIFSLNNPNLAQSRQSFFSQAMDEGSPGSDSRLELRVSSVLATVYVRFPIPDLRQGQGVDRLPWWRRSLHKEVLILELTDADFLSTFCDTDPFTKLEFMCRNAHGLFRESPTSEPVSFVRICTDETTAPLEREEGFDWPRIVIKMMPAVNSVLEEVIEEEESLYPGDSLNGACQFQKTPASPFSSRKVMYENEELVMPGDRAEMLEFAEKAVNNTCLHIDLSLPNVNAILPTKDFFELIYNRINNDLLLWEPLAPAPLDPAKVYHIPSTGLPSWNVDLATQLMHQQQLQQQEAGGPTSLKFSMCKSENLYDSDSESEEEGNGCMYSIHDTKLRRGRGQQEQKPGQSKLCCSLNITKGKVVIGAPLKDAEGYVVKDKHGEFELHAEDGTLFCVVAHNADPTLRYVCIHANRTFLYHSGCVDIPKWGTVQPAQLDPPTHLHPLIYLSEPGVQTKLSGQVGQGTDSLDMLSLALRIKVDEPRNLKEFLLSLGIRGGTMHHRMTTSSNSWFTQILEFFDVRDFPILGYTLPTVVTELHLHLWSCAIDYRPRYLPIRAIVTAETFSISSNIITESTTSLLRFIIDDAALYLSDKVNSTCVDLKKNYVCVMDLGLFELSLRSSDGKDMKYPKTDLRASNNILHIRTCSDSCHALADLIVYIANDRDLLETDEPKLSDGLSTQTPSTCSEAEISVGSPQMQQSHLEHVHDMMADAMRESASSNGSSTEDESTAGSLSNRGGPTEVFFFPDEGAVKFRPSASSNVDHDVEISGRSGAAVRSPVAYSPASSSSASHSPMAGRKLPGQMPSHLDYNSDETDDEDDLPPAIQEEDGGSEGSGDEDAHHQQTMFNLSEEIDRAVMSTSVPDDEEAEHYSADEEFCIIDDPGLGIASRDGKPTVRMLSTEPISIIDNHFAIPLGKTDQLKAPEHFPPAVYRYTLREMSLIWHMYGGKDFDSSPISRTGAISQNAQRRSSKSSHDARDPYDLGKAGWQARGGPGRNIDVLMELQLNKIRMQYESFPENTTQASRQIIIINDVEVRDRLTESKINKFLYQHTSDTLPRQSHANMLVIKALHVRPEPALPSQECSLKVSVQPLRLNIDQDSLFFLRTFFVEITGGEESGDSGSGRPEAPPVMMMGTSPPDGQSSGDPQELMIMFDEIQDGVEGDHDEEGSVRDEDAVPTTQPIYFKNFVFSPDVPIRLDYHGKRVDMQQGTLAGLLVGLAQLNCSELRLKRLHQRHGLLGVDRLIVYALNEWVTDIRKNQLPGILGGVGPMYSLVQLVQGIRDLFWLPVEQYRRDGRIVRGIQRGANSFTTSTAIAALELTNRVVQSVQYAAEVAFDMVSPGPSVRHKKHHQRQLRAAQPADLREGISSAYMVIQEGISTTANTLAQVAIEEHELKGVTGAVGGVLRQIPPTVLQPVIIATHATANVLGGMRNQLRPDRRREDEEKWKPEDS